MTNKIKRISALIFITAVLLVGLLSIYRATFPTWSLTIINGKVIEKKIEYFTSYRSGRHYCLAFLLANRQDKIAINLGTESQADKDSAFYLIDTGKVYKFYLDPTVPTTDGINWGIDKVDYNGTEVYKTSNKLNLYGWTFISILSAVLLIMILKYKKKENVS